MFRRSRLGIAVALLIGLIASLMVWRYTQQLQLEAQQAAELARQAKPVETTSVVVAAQDLPPRTVVTREHLAVIEMPAQAKHARALVSAELAEGKVVQHPISSGEQVLSTKLLDKLPETGLAYTMPAGKRAMSIKVTEVIGAGGLLIPGDKIDVVATFDKQVMGKDLAATILQDIEVLAVAQTLEGEEPKEEDKPGIKIGTNTAARTASVPAPGLPGTSNSQDDSKDKDKENKAQGSDDTNSVFNRNVSTAEASEKAAPTPTPEPDPKSYRQPEAKTVTLAVTPEEAQRLALSEDNGNLRAILRPAEDRSKVDLPEATLSTIRAPLQPPVAQITGVNISPPNARAGDLLKVEITVKNTSDKPIPTQGPNPEFVYVQGQTFHSQNFPSEDGKFRVGINFDGQSSAPFPYRWGLGNELQPGASTTVVGYIQLTYDVQPTNFWAGLIHEPANVVQDNVGTTLVTVVPSDVAVIAVDVANVRSGPDIASSVIAQLPYGTAVPIHGQQKDWYHVQLPDGRSGYVAAGWIVAPGSPRE